MIPNTLFLRLEGPLQAWGDHQGKFVIRKTYHAPTKSGVIGMLCAALGVQRRQAPLNWLPRLNKLRMAVRIDRPGVRWWDYHTVGAGVRLPTADGKYRKNPDALLTRREYLCDASFLVVLQGEPSLISELKGAIASPQGPIYLGRKCCPPSRPLLETEPLYFGDLRSAVLSLPWRPRSNEEKYPDELVVVREWHGDEQTLTPPFDAITCYDVPLSFEPPAHTARFVIRETVKVSKNGPVTVSAEPTQRPTTGPIRPRADYSNSQYKELRRQRLEQDYGLCVFCKLPATTVQHVTYRRAGGNELLNDLRSLCRLCHDAVTMIEYGLGMTLDRINPEDPNWRDVIIAKRKEIMTLRSLETRRRKLTSEEA